MRAASSRAAARRAAASGRGGGVGEAAGEGAEAGGFEFEGYAAGAALFACGLRPEVCGQVGQVLQDEGEGQVFGQGDFGGIWTRSRSALTGRLSMPRARS